MVRDEGEQGIAHRRQSRCFVRDEGGSNHVRNGMVKGKEVRASGKRW